jgi:hypothetical protein
MQTFEGFVLQTNLNQNIEDYLFSLPQNMRHLRSVAIMTDKSFSLKTLADMAEIVQYLKIDSQYISDQSPTEELRFEFLELQAKRTKRASAITFEQTDEAIELLSNTHVVLAGCFNHISSKYQLFLEKSLVDLAQPILLSKDIVSLYKFNLELTNQPNHYLILNPESVMRLCSLLKLSSRPLGLPANNWFNLTQLARHLKRPTVCVGSEHILLAEPANNVLSITRVELASSKYYLYISLLSSLMTVGTGSKTPIEVHMKATAQILQSAGNNGSRSVTLFLKHNS